MFVSGDIFVFWQQGDFITRGVAVLLMLMSIISWGIIFSKSFHFGRLQGVGSLQGNNEVINRFWDAADLKEGMTLLEKLPPFLFLAEKAKQAHEHYKKYHTADDQHALDASMSVNELVTRALRQALSRVAIQLGRGQIFLASIGATAPFVGLLGTVWGIFHALSVIGASGHAALDTVAGPVGEALIMTALGLFVAIPAVLGYNAFTRTQNLIMSDLDGFAHDLQLFFSIHRANA